MHTDEELDYWAFVYRRLSIGDHDVTFEDFLESPHDYLRQAKAYHYLPLMEPQRAVMRRLDRQVMRGGNLRIETQLQRSMPVLR